MNYNLIRNASFQALTSSGTGNKSLNWTQLESLMDGVTTSGGVNLTPSDSLWLSVDMSQRIKLDSVHLYTNDLSKSANINFYYRNSESDSYILLVTNSGTDYYYPTLIDPKAPQFILTTVSGVTMDIYELSALNDDYIVAFGEDGQAYAEYLDNAPVGEEGESQAVAIYNNSTSAFPATGYTTIDYTDSAADNYVKISASENGTYKGLSDGVMLEDNNLASTYIWDMGEYDNTKIDNNKLILNNKSLLLGNYISPIFKMDDAYSSSYFVVDATTTSGITSVSYDAGSYNGTIRVRSSNTEPLVIEEIYLPYGRDARKMIPYNGSDVRWLDDYAEASTDAAMGAVDRRTGDVFFLTQRYSRLMCLYKINRSGNTLYTKTHWNDNKYMCDYQLEFDYIGGIWGYGKYHIYQSSSHRLAHLNTTLAVELAIIHENGTDFLHDFAVEMNGDGVWYTNKSVNVVYHLNTDGNTLQQIVLQTPRAIAGTSDNGCWVMDNTDLKVYRYDFNGNLVKTITLTRYADRMTSDLLDGFWYMRDNTIYHVTSEGVEDTSTMVSQPTMIRAMHTGCVVWSRTTNIVTCIDFNGNITRTFTRSSNTYGFGLYAHNYTDHLNYHTDILPISYDPVWGTGGSVSWKEVRKDGYFLPRDQYHQVELTLRTISSVYTPYVNKLLMAPSIKIEDIPSKNYKNIYIKTDIPSGADITDHEIKLKTWWKIEN